MKILSQCALASVLFGIAQACATPVEISDDIQQVNPDSLGGDSGVPAGGQGSGGSAGNAGLGRGGSGPSGTGGTGPSGSSGAGGQPGGAGGTSGGAAGVSGAGGASGSAGAAGTTGTAGTGGTGSSAVFDAAECDFDSITGCEAFACVTACPAGMGEYCTTSCNAIITCVSDVTPVCATEQDPICGARNPGPGPCTPEADSAGGATTTDANSPAFKARRFVTCLCSVPRG